MQLDICVRYKTTRSLIAQVQSLWQLKYVEEGFASSYLLIRGAFCMSFIEKLYRTDIRSSNFTMLLP